MHGRAGSRCGGGRIKMSSQQIKEGVLCYSKSQVIPDQEEVSHESNIETGYSKRQVDGSANWQW